MNIIGIKSGAVLQRDTATNKCSIITEADFDGEPKISAGSLTGIGGGKWCLEGIPTGGPYEITISDSKQSITFTDIYVGDVWLLAGQSNMSGEGRLRPVDFELRENPDPNVRAIYMNDVWDGAKPQLHQLWDSKDDAHKKLIERDRDADKRDNPMAVDYGKLLNVQGVGPGLFAGLELYKRLGVPQGLIPCAVGGASIYDWTPPENDEQNYYTAAVRKLKMCGSRISGIFWYQGEGYAGDPDDYVQRFEKMRTGISQLCGEEILPAVQVQLCKCNIPSFMDDEKKYQIWSKMRALQLNMENMLPKLATVSTNDFDLDDCIHLNSDSQQKLGKRLAGAMLCVAKKMGIPQPRIVEMYTTKDVNHSKGSGYALHIRYSNAEGGLTSPGVPTGFLFGLPGEVPTMASVQRIELAGDEAVIRFELTLDEIREREMWYGYGVDFYCNITDGAQRAIPSVGPVSMKNVDERG